MSRSQAIENFIIMKAEDEAYTLAHLVMGSSRGSDGEAFVEKSAERGSDTQDICKRVRRFRNTGILDHLRTVLNLDVSRVRPWMFWVLENVEAVEKV